MSEVRDSKDKKRSRKSLKGDGARDSKHSPDAKRQKAAEKEAKQPIVMLFSSTNEQSNVSHSRLFLGCEKNILHGRKFCWRS